MNQHDIRLKLEMIDALTDLVAEIREEVGDVLAQEFNEASNQAMVEAGLGEVDIPEEVSSFQKMLRQETDRGCALACASYLESDLGELLKADLIDDKKVIEELLQSPQAPLSSFNPRIEASYAIGKVGASARRDLHLIRRIRNLFAHQSIEISFDDVTIASRCRELGHNIFGETLKPRRRFVRTTLGVLAVVHGATAMTRHRNVAIDIDLESPEIKAFRSSLEQIRSQRKAPGR